MVVKTVVLTNEIKALAIDELVDRYAANNEADGKSPSTLKWYTEILTSLSGYVKSKLGKNGISAFTLGLARVYILYLRHRPRFQGHPYTPEQDSPLSAETLRCHTRALKAFSPFCLAGDSLTMLDKTKNNQV